MLAFCRLHPNPFTVELPVSTKNPSVFTGSAATFSPAESASVALVVCLWRPSACKMAPLLGQPRCRAGSLGGWEIRGHQKYGKVMSGAEQKQRMAFTVILQFAMAMVSMTHLQFAMVSMISHVFKDVFFHVTATNDQRL